jgi:DNA-binding protein H-NS
MDITKLTLEQMIELQKQIDSALPNLKKQRLSTLQAEIRQLVKAGGYTLDEVLTPLLQNQGGKTAGNEKTSRKPAAVKYQLGDKTWTGKGRVPAWVTEYTGTDENKREELRVPAAGEKTE